MEDRGTLLQGAPHTQSRSGSGKQVFLLAREVPAWLHLLRAASGWYQRALKPNAHLNISLTHRESPYGDSPDGMEVAKQNS